MLIERGSWTPTLQDLSFSNSEGQGYVIQEGKYTRIDNTVFIAGNLILNDISGLDVLSAAYIAGLPFVSVSGVAGGISVASASGLNIPAGQSVTGLIYVNSGVVRITLQTWDLAAGSSAVLVGALTNATNIRFHGTYLL